MTVLLVAWLHGGARAATGTVVPQLVAYDTEIQNFMARWGVPGAAVAVARQGRLVLARGYGVADPATGAAVQPDSLFRIASLSKPLTAAAIMKRVEEGGLSLDLKVFPYLGLGSPTDTRVNDITVRHLLEHSGGWDSSLVRDPVFNSINIASAMKVPSPPDDDTVIRYMLSQPLQFTPGSKYVYANFGYLVLGRVLAKANGQPYETVVQNLLRRAGITRMKLGHSLPAGREAGEVAYAMPSGAAKVPSVFASSPGQVPFPDGGFALESMGPVGGWLASAVDLVGFAAAMDGTASPRADLLSAASWTEIGRKPAFEAVSSNAWYGKGWLVNSAGNRWHQGSLPGSSSIIVTTSSGYQWALVMNYRPVDSQLDTFQAELDNLMWTAFGQVGSWPGEDRFPSLLSDGPIPGCTGTPTFAAGELCLPVVEVPDGSAVPARYNATLQLTDGATLSFVLSAATPVTGGEPGVPAYDPATGIVTLPRVLLPDPGGTAQAWRARLVVVPGGSGLNFRVLDGSPLP